MQIWDIWRYIGSSWRGCKPRLRGTEVNSVVRACLIANRSEYWVNSNSPRRGCKPRLRDTEVASLTYREGPSVVFHAVVSKMENGIALVLTIDMQFLTDLKRQVESNTACSCKSCESWTSCFRQIGRAGDRPPHYRERFRR